MEQFLRLWLKGLLRILNKNYKKVAIFMKKMMVAFIINELTMKQ